ncbi:MAG: hypothetical protein V3S37_01360 [Dehalococcoidia bacterium]
MRRRKWGKAETASELTKEESLAALTMEQADELYRSLPVTQRKRGEFLSNPLQEIRECIEFLLYGEVTYEIRVWEFLDEMGGYRLNGGDEPLAAALLCTRDPLLYGLVNTTVSRALRKMGIAPQFYPGESHAGRIQKVQETLWQVLGAANFKDFTVTDDFLEAVAKGMLDTA